MPTAMTDDGISISYESAGEGPPNLLCLHGWAGSGRYFDATIQQLDLARVRAVTFDLRGHGRSDPADEGYTLDRIAADALAVADAAGLDEFVVLGYSMGAKFGQYLALVAPERVRGLFLLAGCPVGEIPLPAELTEDWLGREGDAARMAEIAEMYSSNAIEPQLLERFGQDAAMVGRAALEGSLDAAIATSFADRVGEIAAPALVVGGIHDGDVHARAAAGRGRRAAPRRAPRAGRRGPRDRDRAAAPARIADRGVPRRPPAVVAGSAREHPSLASPTA